jgi:hypothetical protein
MEYHEPIREQSGWSKFAAAGNLRVAVATGMSLCLFTLTLPHVHSVMLGFEKDDFLAWAYAIALEPVKKCSSG